MLVVAGALAAVVGGAGGLTLGGGAALGNGAGAAADSLAGNLAGDVVDSLPGRNLSTRKAEAKKSAQRGKNDEAFSRLKLKQLNKTARQEFECLVNSTGKVREFLGHTPCTSLDRALYTVGDGHGNAAVISVARVGFRTKADAAAFERVERVQNSGDITPLGGAPLGLAHVHFTGHHYHARQDRMKIVIAETETVAGHLDDATLDALAEVSTYLPQL
jgi:hypothetical protein